MPEALTLASVAKDGTPDARTVLLKGVTGGGFVFFTNYESRKARELDAAPSAALIFYWRGPERQVRVLGRVERVSADESDEYFASRPRESQIGAWASDQSREIPDRAWLENRFREFETKFAGQTVPRPPHWGGYRVVPLEIEFWQGQPGRLHDRFAYRRATKQTPWSLVQLSP